LKQKKADNGQLVRNAEIVGIRLVEAHAMTNIRHRDEVGQDVIITISHGASPKSMSEKEGPLIVHAKIQARVSPAEGKGEDFVSIAGVFELVYRIHAEIKASPSQLQAFAESNAVFNSWPYFREYVQAMTTRMALPPIMLPLFRLSDAKKSTKGTRAQVTLRKKG
jgi:preprotein translocase subunit SecB